jgi:hypothetical protein
MGFFGGKIAPALLVPPYGTNPQVSALQSDLIDLTAHSPIIETTEGPTDKIFLRDVGALYNKDIDGTDVDIPLAPRLAGDQLFVFVMSGYSQDFTPTGWTKVISYSFNRAFLYFRVATADANDNFRIPATASTQFRIAQMASFGQNGIFGVPPDFLQNVQSGFLLDGNTGSDPVWEYFGMTAGPSRPDTLCLFLAFKYRQISPAGSPTIGPIYPGPVANEIASHAIASTGVEGRVWATWGWEYQETEAALPSGTLTYTPDTTFGYEISQATRWEFNP